MTTSTVICGLLIYGLGALITYCMCLIGRDGADAHDPDDVKATRIMTFLSWLGVLIVFVAIAVDIAQRRKYAKDRIKAKKPGP